jgi:hypothetical protein
LGSQKWESGDLRAVVVWTRPLNAAQCRRRQRGDNRVKTDSKAYRESPQACCGREAC